MKRADDNGSGSAAVTSFPQEKQEKKEKDDRTAGMEMSTRFEFSKWLKKI